MKELRQWRIQIGCSTNCSNVTINPVILQRNKKKIYELQSSSKPKLNVKKNLPDAF